MNRRPPHDPALDYEQYRHDVYAWAFRLLGRHHDALDVGQDVFLRWLGQARTETPQHPRSWLRQVTINRAIDLLRARRQVDELRVAPQGERTPLIEDEELRAAVAEAMADLSTMQRSVLIAKVNEGLTFAQIAREHDISVPTAKTHYLRALRAVRDRLEPQWSPDDQRPEGAGS